MKSLSKIIFLSSLFSTLLTFMLLINVFSSYTFEVCSHEYEPACGVDDITYFNSCIMRNAGTELGYRGVCKQDVGILDELTMLGGDFSDEDDNFSENSQPDLENTNEYVDICSNLNRNSCELNPNCQVNTKSFLFFFERFDSCSIRRAINTELLVNEEIECSKLINFVCAEDLKTYPNSCYAKSQGLEVLYNRRCESIECDTYNEHTCINFDKFCRPKYSREFIFFGEKTFEECRFR